MALTVAMAYLAFYLANAPGTPSQSTNVAYSPGMGEEEEGGGGCGGLVRDRQPGVSRQTP